MKLWYLHRAVRGNNLGFIVQETKASGAFKPRACFFSSRAARNRQNINFPEVAAVMTTADIRLVRLWVCAGNLTAWKKFASNSISCLHRPFGLSASIGITAGVNSFHWVYAEGTTKSTIYFRHSFKTFWICWELSQCSGCFYVLKTTLEVTDLFSVRLLGCTYILPCMWKNRHRCFSP